METISPRFTFKFQNYIMKKILILLLFALVLFVIACTSPDYCSSYGRSEAHHYQYRR